MSSPLKTNTETIQNLINQINALPEAGVELPELTNEGSASDLLSGKQLIDSNGNVVTGTIKTRNSSSVTINNGDINVSPGYYSGYIVKTLPKGSYNITDISINDFGTFNYKFTADEGYISGGKGTAGFGKSIPTQNAKTITPTESQQIAVESGLYTLGDVVVEAIPSQYITTTDATASASDILNGKTAYVNGIKITGTGIMPEMATITIKQQTSDKTTIYVYYQDSSTNDGYKILTSSTLADKTATIPIGSLVFMSRNGSSSYTNAYANCSGAYKSIKAITYYSSPGATYKNQVRCIIVRGDLTIS